jgi:hypothetical protein
MMTRKGEEITWARTLMRELALLVAIALIAGWRR